MTAEEAMIMNSETADEIVFAVGDYLSGAVIGVATAAAVRAIISPGLDMAVSMVAGMLIGTAVHLLISVLMVPLLGLFHCMVPGALIGMYGGMLFAMRDAMQHLPGSIGRSILVGLLFGLAVTGAVRVYDRALRATVTAAP